MLVSMIGDLTSLGRATPTTLRDVGKSARFGEAKEPKRRFSDLKNKSDPKPRYGWYNVRNIMLATLGFLGFWHAENVVNNFHTWADNRTAIVQKQERVGEERDKSSPIGLIVDSSLDTIAKTDHTLHNTRFIGGMMDLYINIFTWESLTISILAALAARKRIIYPSELYGELNKRGITGKNMKVAIIDTGGKPKSGVRKDKVTVITPNDRKTGLGWVVPGTRIANMIAEASPDSDLLIFPVLTRENAQDIIKKTHEYYRKCKDNPTLMDIQEIRKIYQPVVVNIANSIKKAVDEGATVVNISYNLEQAAVIYLFTRMAMTTIHNGWLNLKKRLQGEAGRKATEGQIASNRLMIDMAKDMLNEQKRTDAVSEEVKLLYQPFKEALDYAYKRNVPVIIGAGNFGGHKSNKADALGNLNPITIFHHPGLIIVGATNSKGEVCPYTSEYNDEVRPYISANGSNEVKTDDKHPLKRPWRNKFLFPLGSMVFKYIRGVTMLGISRPLWSKVLSPVNSVGMQMVTKWKKSSDFNAPDVTLLYLKMKEVDPSLTIEEAKGIMLEASERAHFSPKHLEQLKKEITDLEEVSVRNFRQGFVENIWTGLHCAIKIPSQPITIPDTLGDVRFETTGETLKISFQSREDGAASEITLKNEELAKEDTQAFEQLWNWVGTLLEKEDAKLQKVGQSRLVEKLLQMELGRRSGHRTIEGRRHQAIALTEERALLKHQHISTPFHDENLEDELQPYPWANLDHFLLRQNDFILNLNQKKQVLPKQPS